MKRRTFLAAVAPLIALGAPVNAQGPLGSSLLDTPSPGARPRTKTADPNDGAADTEKKAKGPTEITSREATLDNRVHLATFSGEVEVKDPEYNLTCDRLTVHLKKPKGKGGPAVKPGEPRAIGAEEDPAVAKPAAKEEDGGGIEKAIAEGNVTIIQDKVDADGKKRRYFGKAKRAVFDTARKTCILYGWPRVLESSEEEGKELIAMQESTVITLDRAGVIKAEGPNRVVLRGVNALQEDDQSGAPVNPGGPARGTRNR